VLDLHVPDSFVLFKTDAVVEGIHFTNQARPEQVGHKALARCLSDIAAMAGSPTAVLVTLGLPPQSPPDYLQAVYAGINALAARYGVAIVGGETTTNPERILISIALLGTVPKTRVALRSSGRPGDAIFVTGELGGSLAGKHLEFEPRVAEGKWLAENTELHAMIDLSDGLAGDLRHILKASQVGAELLESAIPVSRAAKLRARANGGKPPLLAALTDGEDFELLFTVPSGHAVALVDAWKKRFPETRLSCIGKITAEAGLKIRDRSGVREAPAGAYAHFSQP
jgi:thiamine-monophosphate kinase